MNTVPYVVYDLSGRIVRAGRCSPGLVQAQASRPGEQALAAVGRDTTHEVVEGEVLTKDAAMARREAISRQPKKGAGDV